MELKKIKMDDFEFNIDCEDEKDQIKFINSVPDIVIAAIKIATKKLKNDESKEIAALDMTTNLMMKILKVVAPNLSKQVMEEENESKIIQS